MYGKSKTKDILRFLQKTLLLRSKWKWVGHIQRVPGERCSKVVANWYPLNSKRRRGRPFKIWDDDIVKVAGKTVASR